ncbi:hypothetical protein BDQ12DRAFT_686541 [Crucibulum laeve]|uniref:Protein YAE1 n=1 Tax=Crucibulum laeve TaxID=68775 RepID=A0A5C3LUM0_9AGAR|nr:hypothetical protein BDQ12DRAFT_686541 [Crucibulum laeve]
MDSPWDENPDYNTSREAEWTRMSTDFTNVGYREGITAGKESALQEGFDSGFANVGAPIGRDLGILRGMCSAIVTSLTSSTGGETESMAIEARDIAAKLSDIRFSDISPRDLEAEEHARQHLEDDEHGMDVNEEIAEKREVEGLEDMLAKLTAGTSMGAHETGRPTEDDVRVLKGRLENLVQRMGITVNWS